MKRILSIILPLALLVSCNLDDAEYVSIEELFFPDASLVGPVDGGTVTYRVYSSAGVTITPVGEVPEWASLEGLHIDQDGSFSVEFQPNDGFRRGFVLHISLDGKDASEDFVVRQDGVVPVLGCEMAYKALPGSVDSSAEFAISTNIDPELMDMKVDYLSGKADWVEDVEVDGGTVFAESLANDSDKSRKCRITISFVDGWQIEHSVDLYLTQASSSDQFGEPVSFSDARSMASPEGTAVTEDFTIKGIVISDWRSANMELNPCLTLDEAGDMTNTNVKDAVRTEMKQVVDTTASVRTAYVESEDGSMGFRLVFDVPSENNLPQGAEVTISLSGTRLAFEPDPLRYTIYGVRASNILELVTGAGIPEKTKSISELTDDDLYTYVGIRNVEFPVKEGSYTDIRENHALWSEVNDKTLSASDGKRYFCLDGYATSVLDNEGRSICVPINMLCRWRKPEDGIPQGNGTARGIIVHNDIKRYGNAGKYQLRPVDQNAFKDLTGPSAWDIIAGWDKGVAEVSYGEGTLSCDKAGAKFGNNRSYKSRTSVTPRTCGISDVYGAVRVSSPVTGWWNWDADGKVESTNGLKMDVSTAGHEGTCMVVAFRFYAGSTGTPSSYQAFPAHWCVDYSIDGGEYKLATNSDLSDEQYVHLRGIAYYTNTYGSFTLPVTTTSTLGPTQHVFAIPAEALGKSNVSIRIRPYDTVLSTVPSLFFAEPEISNVAANTNATDYVSFQDIYIRYR